MICHKVKISIQLSSHTKGRSGRRVRRCDSQCLQSRPSVTDHYHSSRIQVCRTPFFVDSLIINNRFFFQILFCFIHEIFKRSRDLISSIYIKITTIVLKIHVFSSMNKWRDVNEFAQMQENKTLQILYVVL